MWDHQERWARQPGKLWRSEVGKREESEGAGKDPTGKWKERWPLWHLSSKRRGVVRMKDSFTMTSTAEGEKGEDNLGFGSLSATDRQLRQNQIPPSAGGWVNLIGRRYRRGRNFKTQLALYHKLLHAKGSSSTLLLTTVSHSRILICSLFVLWVECLQFLLPYWLQYCSGRIWTS